MSVIKYVIDSLEEKQNGVGVEKKDIQLLEIFSLVIQRILSEFYLKIKISDYKKIFSHDEKHLIYLVVLICVNIYKKAKFMSRCYKVIENDDFQEKCEWIEDQGQKLLEIYLDCLLPLESVKILIEIAIRNRIEHQDDVSQRIKETFFPDGKINRQESDNEFLYELENTYTRNEIKDFLGTYLASCSQATQYKIVQGMMQTIVFENHVLKTSFMRDVFTSFEEAKLRISKINKTRNVYMQKKDILTKKLNEIYGEKMNAKRKESGQKAKDEENMQKDVDEEVMKDNKYIELSQQYIALDEDAPQNEVFAITADVLYDRSLGNINIDISCPKVDGFIPTTNVHECNEEEKEIDHYHRRFIVATDTMLCIYREKNESQVDSKKIKCPCRFQNCRLYKFDQQSKEDDLQCELQIFTNQITELQNQIGLDQSQVAWKIKFNNIQFQEPQWKHKIDHKPQREILINFRLNSYNDALKMEEYAHYAINVQDDRVKEIRNILMEVNNFFTYDKDSMKLIRENRSQEINVMLYVQQDCHNHDQKNNLVPKASPADNKRNGIPFGNLSLFVYNKNAGQIMLFDLKDTEQKMHFQVFENKVILNAKRRSDNKQNKREKQKYLKSSWGPFDDKDKSPNGDLTPIYLYKIEQYKDTVPGIILTFKSYSDRQISEEDMRNLKNLKPYPVGCNEFMIDIKLIFLSDDFRQYAINEILKGVNNYSRNEDRKYQN